MVGSASRHGQMAKPKSQLRVEGSTITVRSVLRGGKPSAEPFGHSSHCDTNFRVPLPRQPAERLLYPR